MFRHIRLSALIAWSLCAATCLIAVISLNQAGNPFFTLITIPFAITAAFIVSRQPGNVIGWLLMVPPIDSILSGPIESYFSSLPQMPANPTIPVLLMAWFISWNWLGLIFPLFLIPLLFPTGRPPSTRWRWVIFMAAALCAVLLFFATFTKNLGPSDGSWTIPNPIGFLDDSVFQVITIPWGIGLTVMTLLSLASIFVRYRRAGNVERQQIKWLLYACSLFAIGYVPGVFINSLSDASNSIVNLIYTDVFSLAILAFPIAIAIAILRYRLWDIDLIIRRTLIYAALTATLGLVYLGSVILLQRIFSGLAGESSIAIVISTLLIAALFTPLRHRVQGFIDRRFFRQKFDAEKAVAGFASAARNETDLEMLKSSLVNTVQTNLQPEYSKLWLSELAERHTQDSKKEKDTR